ncbi:hypothetical protein SDRG_02753 [Saprolegnia diclina VS20]|uniref:Fe2OG dioxygenase domain-containing protein n=1 Tax=Saprolegnia diclina (strain VS20) TaxID=1156394 RepID=T0QPQ6_SAPDV|nr:hypothetical protein SDRG_02753 [Saprolegnia diclina VS20]EQC40099.1 hypothetical protein SDRG_02753 [Saprolegnia diclina VS20]|eukprot:XP_008606573.1 hypothetical protein SDRG_02753 [Saprolegnia diclina VS20]
MQRMLALGQRSRRHLLRTRAFSAPAFDENVLLPLFPPSTQEAIQHGLNTQGFCILRDFASSAISLAMRAEAEKLYAEGHMFQSNSVDANGNAYPKHNVFASELNGNEWDLAPTILHYTRSVMLQAPEMLNTLFPGLQMSSRAYASKLAVSLGDGASYPKHCDTAGLPDKRKVTMVYYLNPNWAPGHGGELRVFAPNGTHVVEPRSDTLAVFWSDLVAHDVLPCETPVENIAARRYALTLWLVTDNPKHINDKSHHLYPLRQHHFPEAA